MAHASRRLSPRLPIKSLEEKSALHQTLPLSFGGHLESIHRLFSLFLFISAFAAEENFLLINGVTNDVEVEMGPHTHERTTPACSFNIALSLMGYDAGILIDEKNPTWDFQEGYDDD